MTRAQAQTPPALTSIRSTDIKSDIFNMAGDHFRGREAGTLDELKVAAWVADKAKEAGLRPGGDDGTWFQFFSMWRNRISALSTVSIDDHPFPLWTDVLIPQTATASVNAPILFIDKADTNRTDFKGKAVALVASPDGLNLQVSLPLRRYMGLITRRYAAGLLAKGAAAVIFIADDLAEAGWALNATYADHGTYSLEGDPGEKVADRQPVIWLHASATEWVKTPGHTLNVKLLVDHFEYPSVNVIGIADGKDPVLKKEYVVFSGHHDHDGARTLNKYTTNPAPKPIADTIFNGADDNASVSVALLAIARAFHKQPGRRSALFIWHGAEERGLLGSRWYALHPTVPKTSLVAVLNGDMIGRNGPDSAALLGVRPPHRNSPDLVAIGLAANQQGPRFKLDTAYDGQSHIEGWYFRSDHLPYARAGIPALFFTSLLHPDYHTPQDEAARINIAKVTRIAEWMYRTGWTVANNTARPAEDPNFKLER
ncbi:M28 family metallopeptidase [Puia sp.]|uniref:M28 family metallopeptidase n=1 Tax=Puia sp. TaxID=2045100 RepID=UPI002F3FE818